MINDASPISIQDHLRKRGVSHGLDLQRMVSELFSQIPGVVGVGFIDLDAEDFVEVQTIGSHPPDFLSYLAGATKLYFEGDSVKTIQAVLDESTGREEPREIDEVVIRSGTLSHSFYRLEQDPRLVLSIVTKRDTKIGLLQAVVRRLLSES